MGRDTKPRADARREERHVRRRAVRQRERAQSCIRLLQTQPSLEGYTADGQQATRSIHIIGNTIPKIEYHDLVHETRILLRENSNISNEVKNMILERNIDSFKLYVEAFSKHVQRQFFIPSSATMEDVGHAFFNDLTGNVFAFFF